MALVVHPMPHPTFNQPSPHGEGPSMRENLFWGAATVGSYLVIDSLVKKGVVLISLAGFGAYTYFQLKSDKTDHEKAALILLAAKVALACWAVCLFVATLSALHTSLSLITSLSLTHLLYLVWSLWVARNSLYLGQSSTFYFSALSSDEWTPAVANLIQARRIDDTLDKRNAGRQILELCDKHQLTKLLKIFVAMQEDVPSMTQEEAYAALGLTTTATLAEVKKSYKTLRRLHHPDKGGTREKWNQIQSAYEWLTRQTKTSPTPQGNDTAN